MKRVAGYTLNLDEWYSMKDIANILSDKSVPPLSARVKNYKKGRGKRWNSDTISKILSHPAYKGKAVYMTINKR